MRACGITTKRHYNISHKQKMNKRSVKNLVIDSYYQPTVLDISPKSKKAFRKSERLFYMLNVSANYLTITNFSVLTNSPLLSVITTK